MQLVPSNYLPSSTGVIKAKKNQSLAGCCVDDDVLVLQQTDGVTTGNNSQPSSGSVVICLPSKPIQRSSQMSSCGGSRAPMTQVHGVSHDERVPTVSAAPTAPPPSQHSRMLKIWWKIYLRFRGEITQNPARQLSRFITQLREERSERSQLQQCIVVQVVKWWEMEIIWATTTYRFSAACSRIEVIY